jgi:hypothetical protein
LLLYDTKFKGLIFIVLGFLISVLLEKAINFILITIAVKKGKLKQKEDIFQDYGNDPTFYES